ncbi:hypothetical protein EYF80_005371 [Liparis tanakae]|uniref:Uncharacterized protein n=1 Tax=Liparis tanakae TaxID=230148 RepID=A0A4Z2J3X1_9TELE|nr:hypothetical protein EYF80_005371 [Liparis tanakae]
MCGGEVPLGPPAERHNKRHSRVGSVWRSIVFCMEISDRILTTLLPAQYEKLGLIKQLVLKLFDAEYNLEHLVQLVLAEDELRRRAGSHALLRLAWILVAAVDGVKLGHPGAEHRLLAQTINLWKAAYALLDVPLEHFPEIIGREAATLDHLSHTDLVVALHSIDERLIRHNLRISIEEGLETVLGLLKLLLERRDVICYMRLHRFFSRSSFSSLAADGLGLVGRALLRLLLLGASPPELSLVLLGEIRDPA